jgi:putative ABC transport system permease protein
MIGLTVGSIMALDALIRGFSRTFNIFSNGGEIMIRQANVSDTTLSSIDERIGDKIAALPGVQSVSGLIFTAIMLPESGSFFVLFGYEPSSPALQRYQIVEGHLFSGNRQIIIGKRVGEILKIGVGETLDLAGQRFEVVGIYESRVSWEEAGGVVSLRSAQALAGRMHKVTMYSVKMHDPLAAEALVVLLNQVFPEIHASLSSEFVEEMPDMRASQGMLDGISGLSILIGGLGVLNTLLMSVLERTREIGVLRSVGWRRRSVLGLILREAALLGLMGGLAGIGVAFGIIALTRLFPVITDLVIVRWEVDIFLRAISIALVLGLFGGLYPAYRATRLQPVEALRYE